MVLRLFKRTKRKTNKRESTTSTASDDSITPPHVPTEQVTQHPNTSTSNLSTTSTLLDTPEPPPTPPAVRQARIARAWAKAEERRRLSESRCWPHDPWRGGFGPPSHARAYYGTSERREWGEGGSSVREWLGSNGWVRN